MLKLVLEQNFFIKYVFSQVSASVCKYILTISGNFSKIGKSFLNFLANVI